MGDLILLFHGYSSLRAAQNHCYEMGRQIIFLKKSKLNKHIKLNKKQKLSFVDTVFKGNHNIYLQCLYTNYFTWTLRILCLHKTIATKKTIKKIQSTSASQSLISFHFKKKTLSNIHKTASCTKELMLTLS